jgi:hypothetical protein
MACFDSGNIAEKMNHVGEFFIKILGADLISEREAEFKARLTQAGLDARALMALKREIEAQKRAGGTPSPWQIAPTAPGSAANDQWHARADRVTALGIPDDAAHQQERHDATHSDRTVAQTGASLSPRELAVQQGGDPSWDQNTQKVKWEEGTKKWIMNERDMWVQWQRQLGLPLGAGPSGTTNQLMQAAKALRCEAYAARAACIAYLLPAHHHTLVEILAAAQPFGCTYTPGQKMYRKINPFGEDELRNCGKPGPDGKKLFPDEVSGDNNAAVQGPAKLVLPAGGGGGH